MEIKGWSYYNHAAIPTSPPHIDPDVTPIEDKSIWHIDGKTPLLARWTTDFDCGFETNWWYVIKDTPLDLNEVSKKNRKSIRRALKMCDVRKIDISAYAKELYSCYCSAFEKYENADNMKSEEQFVRYCENFGDDMECWGGFDVETDNLIGYMTIRVHDTFVEMQTAKFDPKFSSRCVSDALYHDVLTYYLNECKKRYVSSGSRNINHKTGTQEYKIRRFGYRKAYCNLHIAYNPKMKILIKILYYFRGILRLFDKITFVHQINAVLMMEELVRN